MTTLGLIFVALAALVHVYIFVLESLRFDQPATWRVFGVKNAQEAEVMRPWAYNQGFYNLFLGVGAALGALLHGLADDGSAESTWGRVLSIYCCAFMVAAALVLITSDRRKARAAIVQGAAPALALVFLVLG
jgi:putative membrane protein